MTNKVYSLAQGKYTLYRDENTGKITAKRYSEDWPAMTEDLIGNNLVASLLDKLDDYEALIAHYEKAI